MQIKHTLTLLATLAASSALLSTGCSDNNDLGTVDEAGVSIEEPLSGGILLELPEQPNRPRRQSQSIIIRSNGKADLKITALEWIAKPDGLAAAKSQSDVTDCSLCAGLDQICLPNANGGVCVETGLPETPITVPAGQAKNIELYIEKNIGELQCPTADASVPEQFKEDYCGALRIKTNARSTDSVVQDGEAVIYLTNSGKSGQLRLTETFVEFTGVSPGFSAKRDFAIENIGTGPLTIDNIIVSDFAKYFTIGGDFGVEIAPGNSAQYSIQLNLDGATEDELDFTTNIDVLSSATNANLGKIIVRVTKSLGDLPQIKVDATSLKFDAMAEQTVNIENTGGATLIVSSVSFQPAAISKFYKITADDQPFSGLTIQKPDNANPDRNKKQLKVTFSRPPGTDGESASGTMIINHNDDSAGKRSNIIVLGDAGDVPLGDLRPYSFAFDLNNNASQERTFGIYNYGSAPLTITNIETMALTGTAEEFQVNLSPPVTIPAGGVIEATALFKSENSTPDNVSIKLTSDTSGEPLLMSLTSAPESGQPPVATIKTSFAASAKVNERATFDATGSAPNGVASSAQWVLVSKPAGSKAIINSIGASTGFTPDVAGTYKITLTVTNGTTDAQQVLSFDAQ